MKVSLFITCLGDLFYPQTGMDVVTVLEHFGCDVDFPEDQTCCGQPAFNNGYPADARKLAQRMIAVFENSQYVVTPSGSCCAMTRDHYLPLFEGDRTWERRAEEFVAKTYEFVEFLTKILKVDLSAYTLPDPAVYTYHFTCHLRGLGYKSGETAVNLLKQLGNSSVVPLAKAEQCCGFGGTFAIKYPDISGAMVKDKIACGKQTHADVMIVNDAGCAMNIAGACQRYDGQFKVKHLANILAAAIANQTIPPRERFSPAEVSA